MVSLSGRKREREGTRYMVKQLVLEVIHFICEKTPALLLKPYPCFCMASDYYF